MIKILIVGIEETVYLNIKSRRWQVQSHHPFKWWNTESFLH